MSGPNVFISHRHADKAIAETVADFLHQRSSGAATIFCSSSVDHVAPVAGVNLEQSLKKALALCDVVVLVFTSESEDWSFCMWECGVATDPRDQRPTNVVVFQCGENAPKPYVDYLRVDARDAESVTGFVKTFLTGTDYFPDHEPLTGFASDGKEVKQFGSELHAKLAAVLPAGPNEVEERSASTYLCLEFDRAAVEEMRAAQADDDQEVIADIAKSRGRVVSKRGAGALFGFHLDETTTLAKLLNEWQGENDTPPRWFDSVVDQIRTVVCGRYPVVKWAPYEVAPSKAIIPFVAGCKTMPSTGALRLDIYFVPMSPRPTPVAERMIVTESMFHKNLADTPGESILLADLLDEMKTNHRSRVPMLGEGGRPRFMVHKSLIEEFVSARALRGDADVKALTVHDLLVESERADVFTQTFAVVDLAADMDQALAAMNAIPNCQDVFVTADGTSESGVVGWLTNSMFIS